MTNFLMSIMSLIIGFDMNITALENNNGIMPVNDDKANYYFLTDIFPVPFSDYYFSFGDAFLLIGIIFCFIAIFKRPKN